MDLYSTNLTCENPLLVTIPPVAMKLAQSTKKKIIKYITKPLHLEFHASVTVDRAFLMTFHHNTFSFTNHGNTVAQSLQWLLFHFIY